MLTTRTLCINTNTFHNPSISDSILRTRSRFDPGDPHPPHQFLSPPFRHTLGPLIMERTFKFRRSSFRVLFYVECGTSIHHRNSYPPLYVYSGCKNIIPSNKQRKTLRKLLHYSFFHVPGEEQITFYQSACRECRRVKMTIYFYILMLVVG